MPCNSGSRLMDLRLAALITTGESESRLLDFVKNFIQKKHHDISTITYYNYNIYS